MANSDVLRRIRACSRQTVDYDAPDDIRRKYGDGINKTLYHLTSAMLPEELDQLDDNEGLDDDIIDSFDFSPHQASETDVGGFARRCSKRHLVEDGYETKLDESFEPRIKSNRNAIADLPKDASGLGTIDDLWMNEMSFDGEQFSLESLDDVIDSSDEGDRNRFYGRMLDTIVEEGSDELDSSVPDMSVDGVPWWKLDELNDSLSPSDYSEQSNPRTPTGEQTRQPIISGTSLSQLDYEPEQPDGGPNRVQPTESRDCNGDGTTDTSRRKHVTDGSNDINEGITDHRQPADVRLHGGKRNDRILPSIEAKKLYFEANLYCQPDTPIPESGQDADQHSTSDGERQEINGASSPHDQLRCVPNTDELDDDGQQPTVDVDEDDISELLMPKSDSVDLANESNFSDELRNDISDVQRSRPDCGRLPTEQSDLEGAAQIDQSYTEGVYLIEKAPETISRHPGDWEVTAHVTSKMEGFGEKNTDSADVQPRYSRSADVVDSERNKRCANSISTECHESPRNDSTAGDVNWGRNEVGPTNLHHDKPFVKDARRHTNHSCDFANGIQKVDMGGNAVDKKDDLNGDYRFTVRKNNSYTFTFPKNSNDNKTQVNIASEEGVNVEDVPVTSAEIHCSVDLEGYKDGGSAIKKGQRLVTLTSREPGIGDNGFPSGDRKIRAKDVELCDDSPDSVSEMGHRCNQPTNNNNNSCQLTDDETAGYHPAAEQITAVSYSDSDSKPLIKRINLSVAAKLDDALNQRTVNRMKSGSSEEADPDKKVSGREQTLSQNGGTGLIRSKTGNDSSSLSRPDDHVGQAAGTCTALATSTALVRKTLEPGLQEPDVATVVSAVARAEVSANNPYIAVARASARAASIATASATNRLTSTDDGSCTGDMSVIISTSCTIRGSDDSIREESAAILKAMGDYEQSAVHRFPVTKALTDAATQSTDVGSGAPVTKAKLKVTVDNPDCTGEGQPRVVRTLECDWPSNGSEAEVTCVVRDALREILETGVSLAPMRGESRQSMREDVSYRQPATRHDPREDQGRLNKRSITVSTSLDADEGVAAKRKIAAPGACSTPDTGMSTPDSTGLITGYITRAVTSTELWQLTANSEKFEKSLDQTATADSHDNETCMDPVDPQHRIGITDSTDKTKTGRQDLKDKAQARRKEPLATGSGYSDQDSLDVELGTSSTADKRAKKTKKKKKKKASEVGNNVEKSPRTAIEVIEVKKKKSTKKIKGILKNSDLINIDLIKEVAPSGDGRLSTSSTLIRDENKNTTPTGSSAVDCGGDRRRRDTTMVPGKGCHSANVNEREPAKPGRRSIPLLERTTDFGPRARDPEPRRARGLAAAGYTSSLRPPVDGDGKVPDEAIDQRERTSYGEATTRRTGTPKTAHLGEATSGECRAGDQPTAYRCRDRVDSDIVKSAAGLIVDNTGGQPSERRTGREQCGQEPCGREYRGREQCEKERCREGRLGQEQCGTEQCGEERREREQYGPEQRGQEKCIERRAEEQREKEQEHLAPEQRGQEQRGQEQRGQHQRREEQLAEVHCKQVCGQEKCGLAKCDQEEHQREQLLEEDHELEQRQQRDCVREGRAREDRRHDLILIDIDIDEGRRQRPDYEKLKKRLLQAKPKPPPAPYADSVWNAGQLIAAQSRDRTLTRGSDPDDPYGIYGMLSKTETQDSIRKSKSLGILPSQLGVVESGVMIMENDPDVTNQADRMSAFYVTDLDTMADRSKSMLTLSNRSNAHGSATYREGSARIVDGDNNTGQPLSENEARISRSLSKLSIPDWFMTSPRKDQEIVILRNANARHTGCLDQDKRAWYVTSADTQANRITPVSPKPVVIQNWISSPYRASRGSGSRTPSPGPRPEQTFELPSSRLRSRSRERPKPVPVKALHEIQIPSAEGAGRRPAKEAYLRLRERSRSREANQIGKEKPDLSNYFENRTNLNGRRASDGTTPEQNHQELQHRQSRSRLPYSERHRDSTARTKSDKRTSRQSQNSTTRQEVRHTANTSSGDCLLKDSGLGSSSSSSPRTCDENSNQIQNRAPHVMEEPIYVNVPFVYQQVNGANDRQPLTPNGQENANRKVGSSSIRIDHRTGKAEPRDRNEIDAAQVSNNKDVVQNGYSDIRKKEDPEQKTGSDDSKPWYEEDEESVQKDKITGSVPMDILSFEASPGSRRQRKMEANDVPSAETNQSERKTKSPKKAAKPPGKVRNQTKHGLSSLSKTPKENGSFENLLDGLLVLDSPPTSMIGQQKKTRSTTSLASQPMADRLERALQLLKHPLDYQWGSTNGEEINSPLLPRADDVHNPVCLGSGHSEIIVKCRNKKCRKAATLDEARNGYKTCHNCYTYYCSRECRKDHWTRHKRRCLYSRISSACKRVARLVHDDPNLCGEFTRIARAGYLSRGRGCVLLAFASTVEAERFIRNDPNDDNDAAPAYASIGDIQNVETMGEHLLQLTDTCRSYNPELKYVLNVAIIAGRGDIQSSRVASKRECSVIQLCYKLRLSTAPSSPDPNFGSDPDTLILTAMPGSEFSENLSGKKAREICFINIQRKLRQRGVSLRHQHPEVYSRLCAYVAENEHFTPITIFPMDTTTGRKFMCLIMPDSEPEMEWIERNDLLEQLGLSTAV